jgi:hypothetical protein
MILAIVAVFGCLCCASPFIVSIILYAIPSKKIK